MAARVTEAEVRAIKSTKLTPLTTFITTANILTDKLAASACGSGLSDAELKQIELYLAAHFVSVTDPEALTEKFEGSSKSYQRGWVAGQSGISSTSFGVVANTLSNGCLAELDKQVGVVQMI
jgi:hypothetical protein